MKIKKILLNYKSILIAGLSLLFIAYFLVYIMDIKNLFSLRELYSNFYVPLLWPMIFRDGGPIEIFQWLFLGLLSLFSAYISGILKERGKKKEAIFWLLFAIAGILMLMEDAGDIRHFFFRELFSPHWRTLNILETIYFLVLGAIPTFAVLKYGKHIKKSHITVILLILGFVFYGSSAFLSGPADLTNINYDIGRGMFQYTVNAGDAQLEQIHKEAGETWTEGIDANPEHVLYHNFKDMILEESLEFLGALMLLVSSIAYLQFIQKKDDKI